MQVGGDAPTLPAQVIAFDRHDDLAVLQVPGLQLRPLSVRTDPPSGTAGVIAGYPENGPLTLEPGRIGRTQNVITRQRLRPGTGPAHADAAARAGATGQLGRPDARLLRAGARRRSSRPPSTAPRTAATASPTPPGSCSSKAGARAAAGQTVSTDGCTSG